MPSSSGPNTLGESNLVFAYDTGDTVNSYIGEPTTNLALFSVISGITFNADYAALTSQVADYNVTYRGRPSLRCTSTGQWNIYKYPRPGNYTATSSTVFTFSWKMKWSDGRVPAFTNGYIYTDAQYFYPAVTVTPIEDGWYLCQTISSGTSSPVYLTGFTTTQYGACYIADWQAEAKSHATPFTPAGNTRSATQGLLPLIGNSTIDLSNVSFDSSAKMVFDGTDDYIEFPTINLSGDFTIAQVANLSATANGPMPIGGGYYANGSTYQGYMWFRNNNNQIRLAVNGELVVVFSVLDSLWVGKTIYYAVKRQGTTATLYIDGIEVGSGTISTNNFDIRTVGYSYHPVYASQGNIPVTKIYNRALTAQEIQQNYQQYKTRFNLS